MDWATQLQQSAHTGDLYYSSSSTSGSADGTITWVEHFRVTTTAGEGGNNGIGDVPAAGDGEILTITTGIFQNFTFEVLVVLVSSIY